MRCTLSITPSSTCTGHNRPTSMKGRRFDSQDHTVEWRNQQGDLCFADAPGKLPAVYNLKFALLHLIQAAELLLKCYMQKCEPAALFEKPGSRRTIDLRTALKFAAERN